MYISILLCLFFLGNLNCNKQLPSQKEKDKKNKYTNKSKYDFKKEYKPISPGNLLKKKIIGTKNICTNINTECKNNYNNEVKLCKNNVHFQLQGDKNPIHVADGAQKNDTKTDIILTTNTQKNPIHVAGGAQKNDTKTDIILATNTQKNLIHVAGGAQKIKNRLNSKVKKNSDKNYLSPIIYDIYLKDISNSFWQSMNAKNANTKNKKGLTNIDPNNQNIKSRFAHYNMDILNIIIFYLGTLFNIKDDKGFFFLDYLEFDCPKYNKLRNRGALHSKLFIETQLGNKSINKNSIYLAAENGDIQSINLLLCHPDMRVVKVKVNGEKHDEITNFYNYKDVMDKLIISYSNIRPGLNVHGVCNGCQKYSIVNLGCDPKKIDDRSNIEFFDMPHLLDIIPCNCNRGFLDDTKIEKFGFYKCNYSVKGKMKGHYDMIDICNYADSYIVYDFSDKSFNVLWKSLRISVFP